MDHVRDGQDKDRSAKPGRDGIVVEDRVSERSKDKIYAGFGEAVDHQSNIFLSGTKLCFIRYGTLSQKEKSVSAIASPFAAVITMVD
jgi:hypothetical protein